MPTTKLQSKTPIGLSIPLRNAGVGFFEQNYDTFSQMKTNIINLLNTKQGERRMQPKFGSRLYNAVFEQNTEILPEYITNLIKEDISNWIQNVRVNDIKVSFLKKDGDNENINRIYVSVDFTVNVIDKTDTIELIIDTNRI